MLFARSPPGRTHVNAEQPTAQEIWSIACDSRQRRSESAA